MFADGCYPDRYEVYRPTPTISPSGVGTTGIPDAATTEDQVCRFIPNVSPQVVASVLGPEASANAMLFFPASQDLLPIALNDQPDYIKVTTFLNADYNKWYVVMKVYYPVGAGKYKAALLQEYRNA